MKVIKFSPSLPNAKRKKLFAALGSAIVDSGDGANGPWVRASISEREAREVKQREGVISISEE